MSDTTFPTRRRISVSGVVQGVGFRPFVYRLAKRYGINGWARNTSTGVEIDAEGPPRALDSFAAAIRAEAPGLARVDSLTFIEAERAGYSGFFIAESLPEDRVRARIPADAAACDECIRETLDTSSRRPGYPFTNCTDCGPRFTIIERVPYGRANTTMRSFEMCDGCRAEYEDPEDRRFHAEPIACPECGPRVWLEPEHRGDAIRAAARLLGEGRIVAIKGLGGFHLACDARSDQAVRELRARKGRAAKPFALMVRDLDEARRLCVIGEAERAAMVSRVRPIVLARRNPGSDVCEAVAPGSHLLGLMLPYTPLHTLILRHSPPALVMTSGNLAEEPLAFTNDSARSKLARLADAFLMHDRDIRVPCDDSVVRPIEPGLTIKIRRARGLVPDAIRLPLTSPEDILACGAEQKNTFCVAYDDQAVLSQHIGDLDTEETFDYYRYAIEHFQSLTLRRPRVVAHDLHPDYRSTRYAQERIGATLIGIQHHHAHIAACLAENARAEPCIGVAFDGAGYGTDGTVWGGEILIADLAGFVRVGSLATIRLPGGDAAVRDPRRMAAAYLIESFGEDWERIASELGLDFTDIQARAIRRQLETGLNSPVTSSMGRLFDAVSAAVGICRERSYEGRPAAELEMAAAVCEESYPAPVAEDDGRLVMDGRAVFRAAVEDRLRGTDAPTIAARFQNAIVELAASACAAARNLTRVNLVALSGGVFQNAYVLARLRDRLVETGFEVLTHHLTPPNDGGISLGQAAAAAARCAAAKGERLCALRYPCA